MRPLILKHEFRSWYCIVSAQWSGSTWFTIGLSAWRKLPITDWGFKNTSVMYHREVLVNEMRDEDERGFSCPHLPSLLHQSQQWFHSGASGIPGPPCWYHTQCKILWNPALRRTSHTRSHRTCSKGPVRRKTQQYEVIGLPRRRVRLLGLY